MALDNDPHYLQIIGSNITLFRKEKELTRKELSDMCGIKESKLASIEKGKASLMLTDLINIANVLDVDWQTLTE